MNAKDELKSKLRAMLLTGYKHANIIVYVTGGERVLSVTVKI